MNRNDLPAGVRRLIADALRLAEAERRAQPEAVPVEREYDGEPGLANLKELFSEVLSKLESCPVPNHRSRLARKSRRSISAWPKCSKPILV